MIADRVDRLPGAPGGHHGAALPDRSARRGQHPGRGRHDVGGLGQPARADVAAGQPPGRRVAPRARPAAQPGDVVDHGRVLPHLGVHGRAEQHGGAGRQQGGGEQVRRDPRRVAADQAGGGRGDQDQIGGLAQPGVRDRLRFVPQRGADRLGRQGRERERPDEPGGAPGQHRADEGAGVDEAPAHLHGLVGGDAAAHPQHDPPAPQGRSRGVYWSASPAGCSRVGGCSAPSGSGRPRPAGGR